MTLQLGSLIPGEIQAMFRCTNPRKNRGYRTYAAYPRDEILPLLHEALTAVTANPKAIYNVELSGYIVGLTSDRILTYTKGIECVNCKNVEIEYFVVQDNGSKPHLNAYGRYRDSGKLVMFTSDHIIPKNRGGPKNGLHNRQPMCEKCNVKKGDKLPGEIMSPKEREEHQRSIDASNLRALTGNQKYHASDSVQIRQYKKGLKRRCKLLRTSRAAYLLLGREMTLEEIDQCVALLIGNAPTISSLVGQKGLLREDWDMTPATILKLMYAVEEAKQALPELLRMAKLT